MKLKQIRRIGIGGFGIVDEVQNEKKMHFARKTFSINQPIGFPDHLRENVKKRFMREATVQQSIYHKNIVPVLEMDLDSDPPFFLMPLAISSLQDDITSDKTLGGRFMNALMDIMAALEEIHSIRIYHRDLKPANVLKFSDPINGEEYYAIGDFGLMSVDQTNISTLTQTGVRMGSDYYTAPEIVKDLKDASVQSDIYSLGCILHDFVGIDQRIPCGEIKENSDFSGILLSCTRRDPSRRFKSVTALRESLLSLGDVKVVAKTSRGEEIFDVLAKSPDVITENEWKLIIDFVEDQYDSPDSIAILRRLTIAHLEKVNNDFSALAGRLGLLYAKWIRENAFLFEECDGLSIRLSKFITSCTIDVQAECLMAMLYLGTNHNRWYVEQKFTNFVGKNLSLNLAKRLAIEIRVDDRKACEAINHLKHSIRYEIDKLHPLLLSAVKSIC